MNFNPPSAGCHGGSLDMQTRHSMEMHVLAPSIRENFSYRKYKDSSGACRQKITVIIITVNKQHSVLLHVIHLTRWCRMSHCCSAVYEEVVDCWARLSLCCLFHKT